MNKYITKGDFITLCDTLNEQPIFKDQCTFEPEPITEGGIIFRWNIAQCIKWYKCIRFQCIEKRVHWPFIGKHVMESWQENSDILFDIGNIYGTFLKSSGGAPSFTIKELETFEQCFNVIGITRCSEIPDVNNLNRDAEFSECFTILNKQLEK